jgi:Cdc6-like AAA superfamily ATPase
MVLDQRIGLVGRDETVALIESLVRPRPSRPLPIIVAYGPGGSGKSALLDHVERRYRELPISRVNLDGMGSTGCRDVLAAIFDDLRDYPHPEFGRLRLPRYALAKLAMASVGADTGQDTERRTLARNLLAVRLTKLPQATGVVAAAADVMPAAVASAFKALQPFLSWVASFGVVAPRLVRWLLVGPRLARTLRWYETAAISAEHFNLSHDVKAPAVVAELWKQMGEQEKERVRGDLDNASEKRIDRLLVDAFLADITEAFRRRRRRKVTCLVLLDGADLLDPVENSLFEPSQRESVVPASNFLELLVEARLRTPDAPLLVIATKQSKPADPAEEAWPKADPESNPAEVAQKRYDDWAKQFKEANTLYLPVRLRPFTLPQTAQFLAEWSRTQDYTVSSSTLIEELHEVTKGHPLAVQLTVQVTGLRYRANMVQPAVRSAFAQRLPQGQRTADPDVKVGDYLVFRFLQRFRVGDDIEERERTKELLARLAAPHRIDVETIRLLVPGRDPQDVFERLSRYSFTNTAQQDDQVFLTIHPLLRDLLALSLLDQTGPRPYSYRFVHQQLRDRYRSAGNKPEELYHALALGEVDAVAKDLRRRIRESGWPAVLDHIAEAPILDDLRPRRPQSAMELLSTGASWVRHATQPDIVVLSDLVLATQQLRSATSAAGYQARLYGQLSHAYAAVGKQFRLNGHQQVAERETRYLRLAGTATESGREVPQPLPGFCAWDQKMPYPRTRPGRRTRNATVVTGVLALLATYSVVFVVQQSKSCDIGSPIDVPSVVGSMVDRTLGLSRTASHECVGVTDSATSFAFGDTAHPADVTEAKDLNEIAQLSASIYQENRSVDRAGTDSGAPHVTIVVATMLSTVNAQPYRDLTVGVNELRGAYLAQKNWNHIGTSVRPRASSSA